MEVPWASGIARVHKSILPNESPQMNPFIFYYGPKCPSRTSLFCIYTLAGYLAVQHATDSSTCKVKPSSPSIFTMGLVSYRIRLYGFVGSIWELEEASTDTVLSQTLC